MRGTVRPSAVRRKIVVSCSQTYRQGADLAGHLTLFDFKYKQLIRLPKTTMRADQSEKESLKEELNNILAEARMVLPGMQVLFGFQTIAIFNNRFSELPVWANRLHLCAMCLNGLAITLMMTPTAYHRLSHPGEVTITIVRRYSRLISAAMFPLALSFSLEMCVIFWTAGGSALAAWTAAGLSAVLIGGLWFALPLASKPRED